MESKPIWNVTEEDGEQFAASELSLANRYDEVARRDGYPEALKQAIAAIASLQYKFEKCKSKQVKEVV